jgi:hypothetical protein
MASGLDKAFDLASKAWGSLSKDYFKNWLQGLERPGPPVFKPDTSFSGLDGRLTRLFMACATLTGAVLGINWLLPGTGKGHVSLGLLTWVAGFAATAVFYSLYAGLVFRIRLSIRQTFFAFSFVALPWIPIFAVVNVFGRWVPFGPLFLLLEISLCAAVIVYLVSGIRIIMPSVGRTRALSSIAIAASVIILSWLLAPQVFHSPR